MENDLPEPAAVKPSSLTRRLGRIGVGVVLGFVMLAGGIVVLAHTLGERDTLYEGQTIYQWIAQARSQDTALSNAANVALNRTLIPELTRSMFQDTNDSRVRLVLIDYLNTLPGVNISFRLAATRRGDAASVLGDFGPAAKAAGPALLQALQGGDVPVQLGAASSLGKIQAEPATAIPLLIKYLDDENLDSAAALALADYGPLAAAAVPKLTQLLATHDKDLRHAVLEALSKIQPASLPKDPPRR